MRCVKCGFFTFDDLEKCPSCRKAINKDAKIGVIFSASRPDFLEPAFREIIHEEPSLDTGLNAVEITESAVNVVVSEDDNEMSVKNLSTEDSDAVDEISAEELSRMFKFDDDNTSDPGEMSLDALPSESTDDMLEELLGSAFESSLTEIVKTDDDLPDVPTDLDQIKLSL